MTPGPAPRELHTTEPVHRRWVGLVLSVGLFAVLLVALVGLPREHAPLPTIARQAMTETLPAFASTEPVSAVVYGFRAMDTFGETFLLLAAVVSVMLLARTREHRSGFVGEERAGAREQREDDPPAAETSTEHAAREAEQAESDADTRAPATPDDVPVGSPAPERALAMTVVTRTAIRIVLPLLAVSGLYLVAEGYSPGGGFPAGGVVLGLVLLVHTGFGYPRIAGFVRPSVFEPVELVGALLVILLLALGLPLAGAFAANWVPLAAQETLRSGGMMQVFSLSELIEVATGLTITVFALMGMRHDWAPDTDEPEDDS
jgi:multicomponent Na+:H+ antiporter subunit B